LPRVDEEDDDEEDERDDDEEEDREVECEGEGESGDKDYEEEYGIQDADVNGSADQEEKSTSFNSLSASTGDWLASFRDDQLILTDDPLVGSIWLMPWDIDSEVSMEEKMTDVHSFVRYRILKVIRREGEVLHLL